MRECSRLGPCLSRAAGGEAGPEEALQVARHLPDCTACRILYARERRLSEILDRIEDPLLVHEGFPDQVMAALPEGPPPSRGRVTPSRHQRRGLKLAGLAGGFAIAGSLAWRFVHLGLGGWNERLLPNLDPDSTGNLFEHADGLVKVVLVVVNQIGTSAPLHLPLRPADLGLLAAVPVGVALLMLCTVFALAARSAAGIGTRSRSES